MPIPRTGGPTAPPVLPRRARLPLAAGLALLALGCQGTDSGDGGPSPAAATSAAPAAVETLFPGSGGKGSAKQVNFPTTTVGSSGAPAQNLVFRGDTGGASPVTVNRVILSNGNFEVTDDNCTGSTIGAAETCTISIRFVPTSAGRKTADLRVETTGPDIYGLLSGTATGAQDTPEPSASERPTPHTATPTVTHPSPPTHPSTGADYSP